MRRNIKAGIDTLMRIFPQVDVEVLKVIYSFNRSVGKTMSRIRGILSFLQSEGFPSKTFGGSGDSSNGQVIRKYLMTEISQYTTKLDLHAFHVKEALFFLRHFINWKWKQLRPKESINLDIITGWGSRGTIPKIKPAVQSYLKRTGIPFDMKNPGCFRIFLERH